jgi:hypothetical protein
VERVESPVPAPSKVSLGKRPVSITPPPVQAPQPVRAALARPVLPYAQWEARKVGEIFGVTLSVSRHWTS